MSDTKYKVLLVEDDKIDQLAFDRLIEDEHLPYDCRTAASVSEAQSILSSEKFDVVVVDYLLGDGTAFDVLDVVRDIPVIFVTGSGDEEVAVRAWKAGAYDYLVKDPDRNYLKTIPITIENAIGHKKTEEKLLLLRHAITCNDDIVLITDMEEKIIFVNRTFCDAYGYSEEEVIGKNCEILWKGSSGPVEKTSCCQAVSGWETGVYHRRKDGSEFPISLSRSSIKDEDGNAIGFLTTGRDISQSVYAERELRAINLELKQSGTRDVMF